MLSMRSSSVRRLLPTSASRACSASRSARAANSPINPHTLPRLTEALGYELGALVLGEPVRHACVAALLAVGLLGPTHAPGPALRIAHDGALRVADECDPHDRVEVYGLEERGLDVHAAAVANGFADVRHLDGGFLPWPAVVLPRPPRSTTAGSLGDSAAVVSSPGPPRPKAARRGSGPPVLVVGRACGRRLRIVVGTDFDPTMALVRGHTQAREKRPDLHALGRSA